MEAPKFVNVILALSILVNGFVLVFRFAILDRVVDYQVGQELALRNGSAAWERWINLPVPLYLKVYIFAVSNPEEISQGGKPILKEQGPYVYREERRKKNIVVNYDADTISYDQENLFYFDKEKSGNLSEDDLVTVINPAIMTIVNTLYNIKPLRFMANLFDYAVPSMFESAESVFLVTTVKNLLFDGDIITCSQEDPNLEVLLVCSALKNLLPIKVIKMTDRGDFSFALLRHKNGTAMKQLEIHAGIKEPRLLGRISKWNNVEKLSLWSGDSCNIIDGNDMTLFTPYQNSDSQLKLFSTDICRSVMLEYNKEVTYDGIPGLRFTFSPSFLGTVQRYPENSCYCNVTVKGLTTPSSCLPRGALDVSGCLDVPVIMTQPHFMNVDPDYVKGIDGLQPNYNKHLTFIDIEPRTGIPLQGYQRVQFNIPMENISTITIMEDLPNVLFPLMWIEEGTQLGENETNMLYDLIINKIRLFNIILWIIFTIGVLTVITLVIIIFRNKMTRK